MKKTNVYILIYLSIMLPIFLSAAPIDKYYVPPIQLQQQAPQQQMPWPQQIPSQKQAPSSRIQTSKPVDYNKFENKVAKLSPGERDKLKKSFTEKMENASNNQKFDAAEHYKKLIERLNKF